MHIVIAKGRNIIKAIKVFRKFPCIIKDLNGKGYYITQEAV